jgi:hypothetical protein
VAQHDQRSLALFDEVEMNAICLDRAMRNAAGGLRVAQPRLADGANRCRAESTVKATFTVIGEAIASIADGLF